MSRHRKGRLRWATTDPAWSSKMDAAVADLLVSAGAVLDAERLARRWRVSDLASAAQLSVQTLITLSQARSDPALSTICAAAAAVDADVVLLIKPRARATTEAA